MNAKQVAMAIVATIHETRQEMIEGPAYAAMMGAGVDLVTFQAGVAAAVSTGLIKKNGHVLTGTPELFSIQKGA